MLCVIMIWLYHLYFFYCIFPDLERNVTIFTSGIDKMSTKKALIWVKISSLENIFYVRNMVLNQKRMCL